MEPALLGVHRSGLIVELASVDPVVASCRAALDPMEPLGVPPHVTVLFPFVTGDIPAAVTDRLRETYSTVQPFETTFSSTRWFEDHVLWLAPDDPQPYVDLTRTTMAAFPGYLPYGGEFDEITPHLTVADRADVRAMREAEVDLMTRLPVSAHAGGVTLMTQGRPGGPWTRAIHFPLGGQ